MPRLWQCDAGRQNKQPTGPTSVRDESRCSARMFNTEVRPHHTTALWPSVATSARADRVQTRCACFPLPAWYGSAVPCTQTVPFGRHGLSSSTLFRCSSCTFHRRSASLSATELSQSVQLTFVMVYHLTSSRRHHGSPSNDGSTHCSSAAHLISDSLTPVLNLRDSRCFYCCSVLCNFFDSIHTIHTHARTHARV